MELDYADIGKRIRAFRKAAKLSQEQLAEKTDLSVVHISHIETANTKLSLPALISIANALSVTTDILLCGNLESADENFRNEIADSIKDCSNRELKIIADTVASLKQSLRKWEKQEE